MEKASVKENLGNSIVSYSCPDEATEDQLIRNLLDLEVADMQELESLDANDKGYAYLSTENIIDQSINKYELHENKNCTENVDTLKKKKKTSKSFRWDKILIKPH